MKIIVFVPGIMGSALADPQGREIWPPTPIEAKLTGYRRTAELMHPDLIASGVIHSVCIDFYGVLLERLAANAAQLGGRLVEHAYDWRRDLTALSAELGARLDQLVVEHGADCDITLICHSMGGLIARGWLERPRAEPPPPGVLATRLAVFLAVPHLGAPLALARAIGVGGGSVGLSAEDQRRLSGLAGFPAAYQLLPPASLTPVWRLDDLAPFLGVSAFDPGLAGAQGLNADHLRAAAAFHALLDHQRRPVQCRYFAVASAGHKTVTRLDDRAGIITPVAVAAAGDGTVPVTSAAALPVQTALVEADHVGVAQHADSHALIAMLLGVRPAAAVAAGLAAAPQPALSVSPRFVGSAESYEITVLTGRAGPFDGRLEIATEAADGHFTPGPVIPLPVASPLVTRLAIDGPPLPPGRHRLRLCEGADILDETGLVVLQQPGP